MMQKLPPLAGLVVAWVTLGLTLAFGADETLLLRRPTISGANLAFAYAGDVWATTRDGGAARRLTANANLESGPYFSPDGKQIAYSGTTGGVAQVFVIPAEGGEPRQITFHAQASTARGWTPDGQRVLFSSTRLSSTVRYNQLYTIPATGGPVDVLPMPWAEKGAYAADAKRIAYVPIRDAFATWKHYRGGQRPTIWLFTLADAALEKIPAANSNDTDPVWLGHVVYFLSDRAGTMNVFAYDTTTKQTRQLTQHTDFDVKSLHGQGDALVYEQGGRVHLWLIAANREQTLNIRAAADLAATKPRVVKAAKYIRSFALSPTGARAAFEARGEIITVPAKKGDPRNVTQTPGVHERSPAWAPDGQRLAWFTDKSGEYQLAISKQDGLEPAELFSLGTETSFYHDPIWSPDGARIAYHDKRLNLFVFDVAAKKSTKVDTDTYDHPERTLDPAWSPDGKWLAYTKRLPNHLRAVFVHEIASGQNQQITDEMSDAISATWSLDGKYLYFGASTNLALNIGWLDLSSSERPIRRSLYLVVLDKKEPSPFAPESDEEKAEDEKRKDKKPDDDAKPGQDPKKPIAKSDATAADSASADKSAKVDEPEKSDKAEKADDTTKIADTKAKAKKKPLPKVTIDFEDIQHRIVALPVPEGDYSNLAAAADGKLFYREAKPGKEGEFSLRRFDHKERKAEEFLPNVVDYTLSANGEKLLYHASGENYAIVETKSKPKPDDGKLDLKNFEVRVEPRAEWAQMFREFWRIERDYFYVKNLHGADWNAVRARYEPWLAHVGHRNDLNYLIAEMMGEMVVGHNYVRGGDLNDDSKSNVGLLGADVAPDNGRYRITRIFSGLNWNPDLRAPLTQPGVDVAVGDYVLEVNGRIVTTEHEFYRAFLGTADRQTTLLVSKTTNRADGRRVVVVPLASETALRNRAWVEGNVETVRKLSDGKVAYVYLPNTAEAGYKYFNRYYFAQLDRQAVVIDERFNGGGAAADYVVDLLDRPLLSYWATREGELFTTPAAAIFGPRVMIINEYAGSGGDALPQYFRQRKLGPLVGKTTWGGLVGIYDYPVLMDGGTVTAPRLGVVSPEGNWYVENVGVAPDVDVDLTPAEVIAGHDPQLERAVAEALKLLAAHPPKKVTRPADPVRVK